MPVQHSGPESFRGRSHSARGGENVVRAYATLYEIRAAMEEVFGAYQEPVFF